MRIPLYLGYDGNTGYHFFGLDAMCEQLQTRSEGSGPVGYVWPYGGDPSHPDEILMTRIALSNNNHSCTLDSSEAQLILSESRGAVESHFGVYRTDPCRR